MYIGYSDIRFCDISFGRRGGQNKAEAPRLLNVNLCCVVNLSRLQYTIHNDRCSSHVCASCRDLGCVSMSIFTVFADCIHEGGIKVTY